MRSGFLAIVEHDMKSATASRGSEKLVKSRLLDPKDIDKLHQVLNAEGTKLLDWTIRGQPGPEILRGMVDVKLGTAPKLIGELLGLGTLRLRLDTFCYGMPDPEGILMRFRT